MSTSPGSSLKQSVLFNVYVINYKYVEYPNTRGNDIKDNVKPLKGSCQ